MPSGYGQVTVPIKNTPVPLSATSKKVYGLKIRCTPGNSGANVYVKGTTSFNAGATGIPLGKSVEDVVSISFADLAQVLVDVDTNGDKADWRYDEDTP